ncbi:MAG TPA: amidohydrolase family protein [Beutenbergiaceae bacterium]|nr:amidohydrolase family protein [Beutenbergiaceae bacterium]
MCNKHSDPEAKTQAAGKPRKLTRRRLLWAGGILAGGAVAVVAGGATAYYTTRFPGGEAHSGWLALRGITALTGPDLQPVTDAIVLVQDGQIVDVGSRLEIPEGAQILDAPGATVLPGLIDMHTHLSFPPIDADEEFGLSDLPGYYWDLARYLPGGRRDFLAHGVTSVRSLGDELTWVRELRAGIDDGTLEGPRVFFAGPTLTTPGGHPISTFDVPADSDGIRLPGSPEEAEAIVAQLCEADQPVDVIKVIQESSTPDQPLTPHEPEVLAAIGRAAHQRGVPVTAHCGTVTDLSQAVEAGFDGIEHLSLRDPSAPWDQINQTAATGWPEGVLDQMVAGGMTLDPTLLVELGDPDDQPPERAEMAERVYARLLEAHEAGVALIAGSDAAVPGMDFGSGLVREVAALAAAGLPNRVALGAATTQAAAALGSERIGVLEPGRAADLLVLDGDPLTDLGALQHVMGVLREGRIVAGEIEPL